MFERILHWIQVAFEVIYNFFTERNSESSPNLPPPVPDRFLCYDPSDPEQINWLLYPLDDSHAEGHFLSVGATGSGKTTVQRLLMQSVLPQVGKTPGLRAIVYDAKEDLLPILAAFVDTKRTVTLNPFDERGVAWAIHRDINEPRYAVELAKVLISDSQEQSRFFIDAAREVITAVIISFVHSGKPWTLGDIVRAVSSPATTLRILKKHPQSMQLIGTYFRSKRQCADVFSTINSKMLEIRPVVACWEAAQEEISIHDFLNSEMTLVLGNSEASRSTVQAINRLFFKRACDLILSKPEGTDDRTWIFIDELGDAGRLDGLSSVMKKGRSKGARAALSFQTISSLRNEKVYGPYETDEILGQIANRFLGRIECAETAEWCSKLVGETEFIQRNVSYTNSKDSSTTTSYNHVIARAILASEFMSLPVCGLQNGLVGIVTIRGLGCAFVEIIPELLFEHCLIPPDPNVPAFIPRPVDCQYLDPWTDEDIEVFAVPKKAMAEGVPMRELNNDLINQDLDQLFD